MQGRRRLRFSTGKRTRRRRPFLLKKVGLLCMQPGLSRFTCVTVRHTYFYMWSWSWTCFMCDVLQPTWAQQTYSCAVHVFCAVHEWSVLTRTALLALDSHLAGRGLAWTTAAGVWHMLNPAHVVRICCDPILHFVMHAIIKPCFHSLHRVYSTDNGLTEEMDQAAAWNMGEATVHFLPAHCRCRL